METSVLRKISLVGLALTAISVAPLVRAEIVIVANAQPGVGASFVTSGNANMTTLVIAPVPGTQAAYLMQRSLAWSTYQRGNSATGLPLVAVPAIGGQATATSQRQANLRAHLARAQAYRLGFFNK